MPWDGEAVGEVQVRGPWITASYHLDDDPAKFDDGWLRTGDVATVDAQGFVQITDRSKDVIKSGGEWISSVELENQLMGHPAVREAAVVVVPTRAVAGELARAVGLRDPLVLGEGVSGELAVPTDAAARAAVLSLPERYLLTVATLEPRKGLDVLLAALAAPGAPDLPLLCVGQPGWGGLDLHQLAASAGFAPGRVRVLGRVPDSELAVLLDRATALVVPSRAEGFGLPLLEAMAAGTPVVTSDAAALVEVGAGAARVSQLEPAALAAALAEVAGDDGLRAAMVAAGLRRAADFSWDAAAAALWSALRGLAGGRRA